MDDRVGDILAQRAKLENGAVAAVFFSLLFHATLSGIAVWSAWHLAPAAQQTSVMNIRFAKPAAPEITPAPVASVKPAPPKPVERPKRVEKTAPPSPFGKSKKKPAEVPITPPSKPATQQPVAEVPVGGAGVTALEGGDFPYSIYIERMKTLIGSHWLRPQVGDKVAAIVYFAIDRDGTIRDAKVENVSGDGLYDRAALRAVLEASPLPPLPFGYSGTYLGVHLKFR